MMIVAVNERGNSFLNINKRDLITSRWLYQIFIFLLTQLYFHLLSNMEYKKQRQADFDECKSCFNFSFRPLGTASIIMNLFLGEII